MPENETLACRDNRINKYDQDHPNSIKSHNKHTYSNVPGIVQSRDRTIKFLRAMIAKQICTMCNQFTLSAPSQSQSQVMQCYTPISPLQTSHLQNKSDKSGPLSLPIEMIAKKCETILEKFHTSSIIVSPPVIHEQDEVSKIMYLLQKIDSYANSQSSLLQDASQALITAKRKLVEIDERNKKLQDEKIRLTAQLNLKQDQLTKAEENFKRSSEIIKMKDIQFQEANVQIFMLKSELADSNKQRDKEILKTDRKEKEIEEIFSKKNSDLQKERDLIHVQLEMEKKKHAEAQERINSFSALSHKILKLEHKNVLMKEKLDDSQKMNKELQREKYELCSALEKSEVKCVQSENKVKGNLLLIMKRNEEIKRANEQINMLQVELANARQEQDEEIDLQGGGAMTQMVLDYKVKMNGGGSMMDDNDRVKELASESRRMMEKKVNHYLRERLAMPRYQVHRHGFNLYQKIDQLRIAGLPVRLIEAMHKVRDIGNASTHDTRHVSREEVERMFRQFSLLEKEFEKSQLK